MPGMIVAPQAGAVDIGASVLEQGGNAVDAAVAHYGTRSWADCIAPAIPLARDGYPLTPRAAARFHAPPAPGHPHPMARATHTPAARAIFTRDGHVPWMDGEVFVQTDYART